MRRCASCVHGLKIEGSAGLVCGLLQQLVDPNAGCDDWKSKLTAESQRAGVPVDRAASTADRVLEEVRGKLEGVRMDPRSIALKQCATCAHWACQSRDEGQYGECRRNPPTVMFAEGRFHSARPTTPGDIVCGEWARLGEEAT